MGVMDRPERDLFDGAPYLHVTRVPGAAARTHGAETVSLGHQIQRTPTEPPDGIFGGWHWDGRRVTVQNDRYGIFPLFYVATEREFAISPSIFKLLQRGAP